MLLLQAVVNRLETDEQIKTAEQIFENYRNAMYQAAFHILENTHDAEEAVSDTIVKICRHIEDFTAISVQEQKLLVRKYTERTAIDKWRERKRKSTVDISDYLFEIENSECDVMNDEASITFSGDEFGVLQKYIRRFPIVKVLLAILFLMQIFCSCSADVEEEQKKEYSAVSVISGEYEGYIDTTLDKKADISDFKKDSDISAFLTRPVTYLTDKKTYLIRNFPETLPEGYESYDDYVMDGLPGMSRVIEVYDYRNYTDEPAEIPVEWMDQEGFVPYTLHDNRDDTLTVTGLKDGINYLYEVSLEGEAIFGKMLPVDQDDHFDYSGDCLYILDNAFAPVQGPYTLFRYNINTDEKTVIDTEVEAFSIQDDFVLYIKKGYLSHEKHTMELYRYPVSENTVELLCTTEPFPIEEDRWHGIRSFFYDEANQVIYYSDYDTISAYMVDSGEYVPVFEVLDSGVEILQTLGREMLLAVGNNQLSVYEVPTAPVSLEADMQTLRICWYSGMPLTFSEQYEEVIKIMKAEGISVKIEEILNIDRTDEYVNTVAKKILSGDDDFDLIYLDTDMPELMDEQYYCDLLQFDVLKEPIAGLKEPVRELCLVNDVQTLIPVSLYTTALQVDTSLLSGTFDPPQTFDDIVELQKAVSAEPVNGKICFIQGTTPYSIGEPWFEQIVSNYMYRDMDEETLNNDLKKVIAFCLAAGNSSADSGTNTVLTAVLNTGYGMHATEGTACIPIPKLREGYRNGFSGRYAAINPHSKNRELAALFLAYCMEYDRKDHTFGGLSYLYQGEEDHSHSSVFDVQLEDSIRNYHIAEMRSLMNEKFKKIADGELSVEQAAEETVRYLKMIRDE